METSWVELDLVVWLHDRLVEDFGGLNGLLNPGLLEAALHRPLAGSAAGEFYPDLPAKAACLAHGIATSHPFADGNKRTALVSAMLVLWLNGWTVEAQPGEMAAMVLALTIGALSLEEFANWLGEHLAPLNQ